MLPLDTSWHNTRAVADLQERPNREEKKPDNNPSENLLLQSITNPGSVESPTTLRLTDTSASKSLVMTACRLRQQIPSWVVLGARWWRSATLQPGGRSTQLEGDTWTVGSPGRTSFYRASGKGFGCPAWAGATAWSTSAGESSRARVFHNRPCSPSAIGTRRHSRYTHGTGPWWLMCYSALALDLSRV